ncbi:MAG: hypothetical protein CL843_00775 [Crocinitomicaceae bacterium]|nr:hypothetical protein [Crocinitomicaceae bacterium]|tara:strand:+ start:1020 stop:1403 length:384 start_codon:yes stop_codon:yes gene_type:complete
MKLKPVILIFSTLFLAVLFIFMKWKNASAFHWGHHFTFENELGYSIDSLDLDIGGKHNRYYFSADGSLATNGNANVPQNGYPHRVTIRVYRNGEALLLSAPLFDCYNCDGDHYYTLKNGTAEYRFEP